MKFGVVATISLALSLSATQGFAEAKYQFVLPSGLYKFVEQSAPQISQSPQVLGEIEQSYAHLATEEAASKGIFGLFRRKPRRNSVSEVQQPLEIKPEFFTEGNGTSLLAVNEIVDGEVKKIAWHNLPSERKKSLLNHLHSEVVISDQNMNFGLLRSIGGVRTSTGEYTFKYQAMRSIHMPCSSTDLSSGYLMYGIGAMVTVKSKFLKAGLSLALDGVANAVDFDNQTGAASIEVKIFGMKDPSYLSGLKSFFEGDVTHDNLKRAASFITAVGAEIGDEDNWGDPVFVGIVDKKKAGECGRLLVEARNKS